MKFTLYHDGLGGMDYLDEESGCKTEMICDRYALRIFGDLAMPNRVEFVLADQQGADTVTLEFNPYESNPDCDCEDCRGSATDVFDIYRGKTFLGTTELYDELKEFLEEECGWEIHKSPIHFAVLS